MIAAEVPFRQHDRAFWHAFPEFANPIVAVIEGATLERMWLAAIALAQALQEDRDNFTALGPFSWAAAGTCPGLSPRAWTRIGQSTAARTAASSDSNSFDMSCRSCLNSGVVVCCLPATLCSGIRHRDHV
jgi:hypothetical protein